MENVSILMGQFTKENGNMVKRMGVVILNFHKNKVMLVDGNKINFQEKEFWKLSNQFIKVNSKNHLKMDMVLKYLKMGKLMKANLNKMFHKEKESTHGSRV